MGEEPWRVILTGAPALDNLRDFRLLSKESFTERTGIPLRPAPVLVTFHPETLEAAETQRHLQELLGALDDIGLPVVFTYPGADVGSASMIEAVTHYAEARPNAWVRAHLGSQLYFTLMKHAAAMVGNSSSGIIEAASFRLPVVNIGRRQGGRIRGVNVIDVEAQREREGVGAHHADTPVDSAG